MYCRSGKSGVVGNMLFLNIDILLRKKNFAGPGLLRDPRLPV